MKSTYDFIVGGLVRTPISLGIALVTLVVYLAVERLIPPEWPREGGRSA